MHAQAESVCMPASVHTPFSPVRERERERGEGGRERKIERETERG